MPQILITILSKKTISFVHVDLNAAVPTVEGLELLLPHTVSGSIILLDDYGQPEFRETHENGKVVSRKAQLDLYVSAYWTGLDFSKLRVL